MENNPSFEGKLRKAFGDVAGHPSFILSSGNTVLAFSTGNVYGGMLQLGMTALIGAMTFTASLRNRPPDLPFYALGVTNIISAGIGLHQGITTHGFSLDTPGAREALLGNTALAGWGAGHLLSGYDIRTGVRRGNNMLAYGVADLTSVAANPALNLKAAFGLIATGQNILKGAGQLLPAAFALVGTLRSVFSKNAKPPERGSFGWHATPPRLLGLGYVANGLAAVANGNTGFGMASVLWGAGSFAWDPEQNRALLRDIARGVRSGYRALKARL